MIGLDVGSSLTKALVVKPDGSRQTSLFRSTLDNLRSFFQDHPDLVASKCAVTGSGSRKYASFFQEYQHIKITDEWTASNAGVSAVLANPSNYKVVRGPGTITPEKIIAVLGTGVSYVFTNGTEGHRCGGSAAGGGSFLGLSKLLFNSADFAELYQLAESGDPNNLDLLIGDLVGEDYIGALTAKIVASSMAKGYWLEERPKDCDIAASLLRTFSMAIGCQIAGVCKAHKAETCVLIGGFLDQEGMIQTELTQAVNLFNPGVTIVIPNEHHFVGAWGTLASAFGYTGAAQAPTGAAPAGATPPAGKSKCCVLL
jgi:type II pantothenate kinase